jgi:hypothetical protein
VRRCVVGCTLCMHCQAEERKSDGVEAERLADEQNGIYEHIIYKMVVQVFSWPLPMTAADGAELFTPRATAARTEAAGTPPP